MNISLLYDFELEIKKLFDYIDFIQLQDKIFEHESSSIAVIEPSVYSIPAREYFKTQSTNKKIFEYNTFIISLYGLIERHFDLWTTEFLISITGIIPSYNLVSERIRKENFDKTIKLLTLIREKNYTKYRHLKEDNIIEKLHLCLQNSPNYGFIYEAFLISSGNLKHSKIADRFQLLDISLNDKLKIKTNIQTYISQSLGIENIANLNTQTIYSKLDDLVDRRNDIAHGQAPAENILNLSEIKPYIEFVSVYGKTLFEVLEERIIEYESSFTYFEISKKHQVWNNSILGFEAVNCNVKVGDFLIIKHPNETFIKKKIIEIQINNTPYDEISITIPTDVAIRVEGGISINDTFFLSKKQT